MNTIDPVASEAFTDSIYAATKPLIRKVVPGGLDKVEALRQQISEAPLSERHRKLCNLRIEEALERQRGAQAV